MKNKTQVILCVVATALLFASMEPVSKLIAGLVSPAVITCFRFLLGGIILLPLSFSGIYRRGLKLRAADWLIMSALGVLIIASMLLLQYAVRESNSPSLIAIIFSSNSVMTILFAVPLLGEKITWQKILAVLLCLGGVAAGSDFGGGTGLAGILFAVGAALTFSLYTVLSKRFMRVAGGAIQSGISFTVGSLVLLAVLLCTGTDFGDTAQLLSFPVFPVMMFLAVAVTGIGYLCFFRALDLAGAAPASLVFFIKPVITPFVSWGIARLSGGNTSDLSWRTFAALALVLAGSVLVTYTKKPKTADTGGTNQ